MDTVGLLPIPGYTTTPAIIAVAELAFPLWLLVKGVDTEGWQDRPPALKIA